MTGDILLGLAQLLPPPLHFVIIESPSDFRISSRCALLRSPSLYLATRPLLASTPSSMFTQTLASLARNVLTDAWMYNEMECDRAIQAKQRYNWSRAQEMLWV